MRTLLKCAFDLASRMLPPLVKAKLCFNLAQQLGIRKIYAEGDYGELLGYVEDRALFMRYLVEGTYMPALAAQFANLFGIRGGGTYLDIGANIGATTIPIARDRDVACYAFEPDPGNFFALERNVGLNCPHANVRLFNLALFDQPGELQFELSSDNPGDHRVRVGKAIAARGTLREDKRAVIAVEGARLDDLLSPEALRTPICAKIDIQGAEANLYRGGRKLLRACEMIVTEFWPYGLARMGEDPAALLTLFAEDFSACRIEASRDMSSGSATIATSGLAGQLAALMERASPADWVDLVLLKRWSGPDGRS